MKNQKSLDIRPPTILSFANDLANLCSLSGLLSSVLAIYFAIMGNYPGAMIGLAWAVFFDWSDGKIARRSQGRTDTQKLFGGQLDSLIDIISFGVCPAIILLSIGDFSPWYLPGAFIIVAAGVLRLSYFNVFGLIDKTCFRGLAIDNNGIFVVLVFILQSITSAQAFANILYGTIVMLAILNTSSLKTPKLSSSGWYYAIVMYTLVATLFFGWRLMVT